MRLKLLSIIILISFLYLIIGLGYTQIIKGEFYKGLSENNRIRLIPIPALRGNIYDRNGTVLANSRPSFDACIVPQDFKDEAVVLLAKVLDLTPEEILHRLAKGRSAPFAPVVIARDIGQRSATILEEHSRELPGVVVQVKGLRYYPQGGVCSHILGYMGYKSFDELEKIRRYGYQVRDLVGRTGVEERYDGWLRGEDGGKQVEVDYKGRFVKILGERPPKGGKDLHLTIDIRLQQLAWDLLEGKFGAIIVMDPRTGEVLAMVSRPDYDPNWFIDPGYSSERYKILEDPSSPLLNRAISCYYPPGSTFKVVVALSALELGKISPATHRHCEGIYYLGGRGFRCWNEDGHGSLRLEEAIAYSCNIFFYQVGLMVGVDHLAKMARYLGYGKPTGIELPSEARGLVPTRRWKKAKFGEPWYDGETANLSIGQGYLSVTPLQAARMISAIATDGTLPQPHLVKIPNTPRVSKRLDILARNIKVVKGGMVKGVSWEGGTCHRAWVPGLAIAAKTGTAQVEMGRPHSWFIGFCPAEDPKIVFCVFLEHGGYGSQEAARLAGELIRGWSEIKKVTSNQ